MAAIRPPAHDFALLTNKVGRGIQSLSAGGSKVGRGIQKNRPGYPKPWKTGPDRRSARPAPGRLRQGCSPAPVRSPQASRAARRDWCARLPWHGRAPRVRVEASAALARRGLAAVGPGRRPGAAAMAAALGTRACPDRQRTGSPVSASESSSQLPVSVRGLRNCAAAARPLVGSTHQSY